MNAELGLLDEDKAERIAAAGDRIATGELDDQFPIDVFQTGSGTSSNMNANEVIAALAGDDVHANDDVNMGQSSNDVFPSAVHLAALDELDQRPAARARALAASLEAKAREFDDVVKSGRTHWMDAVPVTLGQEFGGYAAQVRQGIARVRDTLPRLGQIPLGGTAVGTGLNTHPEFAERVRARLASDTGLEISPPADPFEAQAARDGLVEASGALKTLAVSLTKIANDLRFMGSGPRAGLAEIALPELQKGSSIMPGKVNPVIPEVVTQVAAQVIGNDAGDRGRRDAGPLRAQRLRAADRPQPARLDPAAGERLAAARREVRRRDRGQPRELRALRGADAVRRDRAQPVHRLRQGGRDRQGGRRARAARCARSRGTRGSTTRRSTRRSTTAPWPSRTTPNRPP